jgi:hypothetical protein
VDRDQAVLVVLKLVVTRVLNLSARKVAMVSAPLSIPLQYGVAFKAEANSFTCSMVLQKTKNYACALCPLKLYQIVGARNPSG